MKKPRHTKLHRPEIWEMAVNDADVVRFLRRAGLPPLDPQAVHDLAARVSSWADSWRHYSKHPEAKTPLMVERNERYRRIATALETLQTDLAAFRTDAGPDREVYDFTDHVPRLLAAIEPVARTFASYRNHAGTERWHRIADDIESTLLREYPDEKPKVEKVRAFIANALAMIGVNVSIDAIRKRK